MSRPFPTFFFECVVARNMRIYVNNDHFHINVQSYEDMACKWPCGGKHEILNCISAGVCWGIWLTRNDMICRQQNWQSIKIVLRTVCVTPRYFAPVDNTRYFCPVRGHRDQFGHGTARALHAPRVSRCCSPLPLSPPPSPLSRADAAKAAPAEPVCAACLRALAARLRAAPSHLAAARHGRRPYLHAEPSTELAPPSNNPQIRLTSAP